MTRQELIKDLRAIRYGLDEKNNLEAQKISEYFHYEDYMDYIPIKPEAPVKPEEPKNKDDRNLEQVDPKTKRTYYYNDPKDVHFRLERWQRIVMIVFGVISILTLITGCQVRQNGESMTAPYVCSWNDSSNCWYDYSQINEAIRNGNIMMIVAAGMVGIVPIMLLISLFRFVIQKAKAKAGLKTQDEEHERDLIKQNIQYQERKDRALKDYAKYEKDLAAYNEELEDYNYRMNLYNQIYEEEKEKALKKIRTKNAELDKRAKAAFDDAMASVTTDYPERYYGDITAIINILEDMRADTLKEALAVLEDDKHKQEMLWKQQQLIEEQENYNRELERQGHEQERMMRQQMEDNERHHREQMDQQRRLNEENERRRAQEAEDARRAASAQCSRCNRPYMSGGCPMEGRITSACPNYIHRDHF